ncbi:hypothetical protein [Methylobacterium sp. Leaf88]|uniref:hypothetical protein n=1 Tax=Methylobacterium sp. Leaf88 TaxID=1736244 RepID=UPI0006F3ADEC|nr:hypothetical protein [Methylobacterium sp. Leaf88]KQO61748.1 hypothetical protein ASF20_09770 [Methylobacterium sp. Leaf88]
MTSRVRIRAAATDTSRLVIIEAHGTVDIGDLIATAGSLLGPRPEAGQTRVVDLTYEEPASPPKLVKRRRT